MPPILRGTVKTRDPGLRVVAGSFVPGVAAVAASYTQTLVTGTGNTLTVTANTTGTAGNSYKFNAEEKTNDDRKSILACAGKGVTNLDTVLRVAAAGVAGDAWKISILPHAVLGGGVLIYEDNTTKTCIVLFETGVSTVGDLETAFGGATYIEVGTTGTGAAVLAGTGFYEESFSGGTDATTWAEKSGVGTVLYFIAGTTDLTAAMNAINGISGGIVTATIAGTASTTFATGAAPGGDDIAEQTLSGGVDGVAIASTLGEGFSVQPISTGLHRVTLDTILQAFHMVTATVQATTGKNLRAVVGPIVQASKYFDIYTLASGTLTDGASTDRIHFVVAGRDISR